MIRIRGHRSYQCFFQKAELAIPDQFDAGEDRGEQDGHGDDAGREKLDVIALAGLLKDRSEAEAERDQKQQRLAERSDDARLRST